MIHGLPLFAALFIVGCSSERHSNNIVEVAGNGISANSTNDKVDSIGELRPQALRVATYSQAGMSMLSRISVLLAEDNGCLVGRSPDGLLLLVFKAGTISTGSDGSITYSGQRYRLGDKIVLGGGMAPTSGESPHGLVLQGCGGSPAFLVG